MSRAKTVVIPDKYFEGKDSDDYGDTFRAIKEMHRDINHSRLLTFVKKQLPLLKTTLHVTEVKAPTTYHYKFRFKDTIVNYYPSTGKWVINNKTRSGGFESMMGFLKNRNKEA